MMKKWSIILLTLLVLAGCNQADDRLVVENNTENLLQTLIDIRLDNLSFEQQAEEFNVYRTRIEYEVWEDWFNTSYESVKGELAIAEFYELVPISHRTLETLYEWETADVLKYLHVRELTAVPTGASKSDKSQQRKILLYYVATFNQEGVLTSFNASHKLE